MDNKKEADKIPIAYFAEPYKMPARVLLQYFAFGFWLFAEIAFAIIIFRSVTEPEPMGYWGNFIAFSMILFVIFAVVVIVINLFFPVNVL